MYFLNEITSSIRQVLNSSLHLCLRLLKKTTKQPNTFTAQDAGICSNAQNFWNRIIFPKHTYTTLQILGKFFYFTN